MNIRSMRLGVTMLACALSAPLFAQDNAAPTKENTQPSAHAKHGEGHHNHRWHHGDHHKHFIGTLKHVRPELKLTAQQDTEFDALIKGVEGRFEKAKQEHQNAKPSHGADNLTSVQRFEHHLQQLEEHTQNAKATLEDFKRFYASLQPEQQKLVDQAFAHHHGHHHHKPDHVKK